MSPVLRRLVLVVSVAAAAAALVNWWRQRDHASVDAAPPEWPAWPDTAGDSEPTPSATWIAGTAGHAPDGYPIKLNGSSGIFHVPGGRFYGRTRADRWYATADAAVADGYRQSKS
jgi:hypothetical protein